MNIRMAILVSAGVWGLAVSQSGVQAEQGKTVWDGVYTAAQAARGLEAYKAACSECHGADLKGDGFAPPLSGDDFQGNWNDLSVGDFFERIRISMPPSDAASVTPAAKADIVAYVLAQNKYPEGQTEIQPKLETLKDIKILIKP
jgi:S-disulfanyl-L-cysteine oxidoreductase SoxD